MSDQFPRVPRLLTLGCAVATLQAAMAAQDAPAVSPPPSEEAALSTQSTAPATDLPPVPAADLPNPDIVIFPVRSPGDDGYTPGEGPTSPIKELDEIFAPRRGIIRIPGYDDALDALFDFFAKIDEDIGLRTGFAYTSVFAIASGGPGNRNGFSGDVDLMFAWTLLGRGTADTGTLVFTIEDRFRQSTQTANALGRVLEVLTTPVNAFNDRGFVIRDLHWRQRLFDDRLRLLVGRADPSDYLGTMMMANANNAYLNRSLATNPSVAWPGHTPTLGATLLPTDWFYATFGVANAYGTTTTTGLDTIGDLDLFWGAEFGVTPTWEGLGTGRYRIFLWQTDARPNDNLPLDRGLSVVLEQNVGDSVFLWARYNYADATVTNIRQMAQGGFGLRGLLGSPDDLTGFGFSYGQPRVGLRDEKVLEVFHRFQLTPRTQLTFDAQLIVDPSYNPTQDVLGVFAVRLRIEF
ncbi:MAG: carbohydrate porin [Phycisphaeraceae bacterium]|nr:carbohydrate porin [Phycisphaeraceae bacterium]